MPMNKHAKQTSTKTEADQPPSTIQRRKELSWNPLVAAINPQVFSTLKNPRWNRELFEEANP
jgi:hypothetical protein